MKRVGYDIIRVNIAVKPLVLISNPQMNNDCSHNWPLIKKTSSQNNETAIEWMSAPELMTGSDYSMVGYTLFIIWQSSHNWIINIHTSSLTNAQWVQTICEVEFEILYT